MVIRGRLAGTVKKIMKSLGLFREDTQSSIMEKIGWLVDRLVFNGTFSINRLYHAIEVRSILCRDGRQDKRTIK